MTPSSACTHRMWPSTATLSTAPKPVIARACMVASVTWYSAGPAAQRIPAGPAASVASPRAPFAEVADGHGYNETRRLTADHGGSIRLSVPSMSAHASRPEMASALVYWAAPVL